MDQMHKRSNVFYFIGLKMSYEMPMYVVRQLRLLVHQLLHVVLPEIPLPQPIQLPDSLHGLRLGNGHQLYARAQLGPNVLINGL